jgi:hypothetical protein
MGCKPAMIEIPIYAYVSRAEQVAVQAAARHLDRSIGDPTASGTDRVPIFVNGPEALAQSPLGAVRLISLVPELLRLDGIWSEQETRLRSTLEALTAAGDPVFIFTVLRHAGHDDDSDLLYRRRVRIRRLNLLAAEVSRQTGAFVVDIDRVIADIGGRNLEADYRLDSPAAAAIAGCAIALCIVANGLDAFVSFEMQEKAREVISGSMPGVNSTKSFLPTDIMILGRGRRAQTVATTVELQGGMQVSKLLRHVMKRELAFSYALDKLVQGIRSRGLIESSVLLALAVLRMMRGD